MHPPSAAAAENHLHAVTLRAVCETALNRSGQFSEVVHLVFPPRINQSRSRAVTQMVGPTGTPAT